MQSVDSALLLLALIAFFAAFVNGAIGYGFSSLTVPIALTFLTNRVLNPAIVLMEVGLNLYVLFINRSSIPAVWRKVLPVAIGLLPGIAVGSAALAYVHPGAIKLVTYLIILPMILIQAAGWRRPFNLSWGFGLPFGSGLGVLYSLTTISGPPLAVLFNNQGLVKTEFRAGLAIIRTVESVITAIVYYNLGLFISDSQQLLPYLLAGVAVGIPLGSIAIRHMNSETFRRICMSFDAWVVGFGLSRVLIELKLIGSPWAYGVMAATILIDCYLLYLFFSGRRSHGAGQVVAEEEPLM